MNIFMTNENPVLSAKEHCLVHNRKMILEYAQMLSTTHHHFQSPNCSSVYKIAHYNHPSTKWVREHFQNYNWLFQCWQQLLIQFEQISNKSHAASRLYEFLIVNPHFQEKVYVNEFHETTKLPCAMPNEYKLHENPILNYHEYLNAKFSEWKSRKRPVRVEFPFIKPDWYKEKQNEYHCI